MMVTPMEQLERLRVARIIKKNEQLRDWKATAAHNFRCAEAHAQTCQDLIDMARARVESLTTT